MYISYGRIDKWMVTVVCGNPMPRMEGGEPPERYAFFTSAPLGAILWTVRDDDETGPHPSELSRLCEQ